MTQFDEAKIDKRAQVSFDLHMELGAAITSLGKHEDLRQIIAADSMILALVHHGAISTLIIHKFWPSGFALIRPIVECVLRGHWALYAADEQGLKQEANGTSTKNLGDFCRLLRKKPLAELKPIIGFAEQLASVTSSFTHGGYHLLHRRESGFKYHEVINALSFSDMFAMFAAEGLAAIYDRSELQAIIDAHVPRLLEEDQVRLDRGAQDRAPADA